MLAGLCGVIGPVVLVTSFVMNPGPPPGLSAAALIVWAHGRVPFLLFGGWLQGIGSALMVIFCLAVIEVGGIAGTFLGRLTQLAGSTILAVSLIEVTFYIAAAHAIVSGDARLGLVTDGLIRSVQHVFLIAPALLIPVGWALVKSRTLGPLLAYSALAIGIALQMLGLAGMIRPLQPIVDDVLYVQAAWFVFAGIALAFGRSIPESL